MLNKIRAFIARRIEFSVWMIRNRPRTAALLIAIDLACWTALVVVIVFAFV